MKQRGWFYSRGKRLFYAWAYGMKLPWYQVLHARIWALFHQPRVRVKKRW